MAPRSTRRKDVRSREGNGILRTSRGVTAPDTDAIDLVTSRERTFDMAELDGFVACDPAPDYERPKGKWEGLLDDFLASGNAAMSRDYDTPSDAQRAASSLRGGTRSYNFKRFNKERKRAIEEDLESYTFAYVRIHKRGKTVLLERREILVEKMEAYPGLICFPSFYDVELG